MKIPISILAACRSAFYVLFPIFILGVIMLGCAPTVKVEAPDKPIEINLNIRIQQEVRILVERDVSDLIEKKSDIY